MSDTTKRIGDMTHKQLVASTPILVLKVLQKRLGTGWEIESPAPFAYTLFSQGHSFICVESEDGPCTSPRVKVQDDRAGKTYTFRPRKDTTFNVDGIEKRVRSLMGSLEG